MTRFIIIAPEHMDEAWAVHELHPYADGEPVYDQRPVATFARRGDATTYAAALNQDG